MSKQATQDERKIRTREFHVIVMDLDDLNMFEKSSYKALDPSRTRIPRPETISPTFEPNIYLFYYKNPQVFSNLRKKLAEFGLRAVHPDEKILEVLQEMRDENELKIIQGGRVEELKDEEPQIKITPEKADLIQTNEELICLLSDVYDHFTEQRVDPRTDKKVLKRVKQALDNHARLKESEEEEKLYLEYVQHEMEDKGVTLKDLLKQATRFQGAFLQKYYDVLSNLEKKLRQEKKTKTNDLSKSVNLTKKPKEAVIQKLKRSAVQAGKTMELSLEDLPLYESQTLTKKTKKT